MVTRTHPITVEVCGQSDPGRVRENNEDAWLIDAKHNVFVLADGMGGHKAGEVAAKEAVNVFSQLVKATPTININEDCSQTLKEMEELIQEVNFSVYSKGRKNKELRGMGTTLCCVYLHESGMVVGHVGDSRVYHLRGSKLNQITEDHSLVTELLDLGELNQRQARDYAFRNIITKAIGAEANVEPTVQGWELEVEDQVLMCSDGLSDHLSLDDIEMVLNQKGSVEDSVQRLIDSANEQGGHDNITVVLLKVLNNNEKTNLS